MFLKPLSIALTPCLDKNCNLTCIWFIGKLEVVPQDIGRVLLNLYKNAFYALAEKRKKQGESYPPTISVSTKRINDQVEIRIADNGTGISQKVADKIFQPFFTTKPQAKAQDLAYH